MRVYQAYSVVEPNGICNRFKPDRSIRVIAEGYIHGGCLVTDVGAAGHVAAQRIARKGWGRTAEAIVRRDGRTFDGAIIFYAEIWTGSRTRLVGDVRFAIKTIEK
ncbi:hypothetical protein JJB98_23725 [Bradyrhizobium diazoefficiens]|nr:hypothetical protein [Bradyrhizobium diazoefficiens]QQO22710.1 hypothetical protein JJB98_23725 [Bradyrhizobium diazoefficiens]